MVDQLRRFWPMVVLEIHQAVRISAWPLPSGQSDLHVHQEVEEAEWDSHKQSREELVLLFLFDHLHLILPTSTVLFLIVFQLGKVFGAQLIAVLIDDPCPCQVLRYGYI